MKKLPTILSDSSRKPDIDYPCTWQYTIIAESRAAIQRVAESAAAGESYSLKDSHVSRSGKYVSMHFELTVTSEQQRLELYTLLSADQEIKVIL